MGLVSCGGFRVTGWSLVVTRGVDSDFLEILGLWA